MLTRKLIFIILQMKMCTYTQRECVISNLLCKQKFLPKILSKPSQYIGIRINTIPDLKNGVNRKIKRRKKYYLYVYLNTIPWV